jgi:phage shock protein A
MALMTRISKLLTADAHAVLDRLEEPEALLKQAVRDMEEALAQSEQSCRQLQQEQQLLSTRARELEKAVNDLNDELDICFESKQEDLARSLVRRKLEMQRLSKTVAEKRDAANQTLSEQQALVEENRLHLLSMKQKCELLVDVKAPATAFDDSKGYASEYCIGDDEVEVAFLREKQRRAKK